MEEDEEEDASGERGGKTEVRRGKKNKETAQKKGGERRGWN